MLLTSGRSSTGPVLTCTSATVQRTFRGTGSIISLPNIELLRRMPLLDVMCGQYRESWQFVDVAAYA